MAAAARSTWTDARLDDLKDTVAGIDEKVTRLDQKVDEGFARLDQKVDGGFGRLDGRIDSLHHTLVHGMIALISIITVLLSILVAIVATHL
jgi:hypothetical protein